MRVTLFILIAPVFFGCVSVGGTVATPTALENQMLGVYEDLDEDLVYASSVRSRDKTPFSTDSVRSEALAARSLQLFNRDELSEFKSAGCIAETLSAELVKHKCSAEDDSSAVFEERRMRIIRDENRAREKLVRWAAYLLARKKGRNTIEARKIQELRKTYYRMLKEGAGKGHIFQRPDGSFESAN